MRVEVLSDHSGQQLQLTRQRLDAAVDTLAARDADYRLAHQRYQAIRRGKPFWRRLFRLPVAEEHHALARAHAARQQLRHAEHDRARLHRRSPSNRPESGPRKR